MVHSVKMEPEGEDVSTKNATPKNKSPNVSLTKVFKSDFDAKYNILDIQTPLNAFLSGQFKRSYAYYTLQNILPVVLTKIIDSLTKDKSEIVTQFGENAREELKIIIGLISRLKYELQTDKPFQKFTGDELDRELWNDFIESLPSEGNTFYQACWLHTDCYTYRKLYSFVENSIFLKEFDYFSKIKEHVLSNCQDDILALAKYSRRTENSLEMFSELLKFDLWSNRNNLSEDEFARMFNMKVLDDVTVADAHILINDTSKIWECLSNKNGNRHTVDYVLDNVGYDLFTGLILAEYMLEKGLATKVRFHAKAFPCFGTSVTHRDFHMTLEYLSQHPNYIISLLGNKFSQFVNEHKFELAPTSYFWTAPHAMNCMRTIDPELFETLQNSKLIIFKGDFNYRKLLSDVCWQSTQDLKSCLGGFAPSSFCIIRSIKSEVICGLSEDVSESLNKKYPGWMVTGNYGTIQLEHGTGEFGY